MSIDLQTLTLECGPVTLRRESGDSRVWRLRINGELLPARVDAGIVVPNARRAHIAISQWSPQNDPYAQVILRLLLHHLFVSDKAHQVAFTAIDTEQGLFDAALKCGFLEEGRRRHTVIVDGYWRDHICMTLFESQWHDGVVADPGHFEGFLGGRS